MGRIIGLTFPEEAAETLPIPEEKEEKREETPRKKSKKKTED